MPRDTRASDAVGRERLSSFDEVFAILGDETRIEILMELGEVAHEKGIGSGLTFATLRDRVDVADSGRFNYHLNRLTDQFVAKSGDAYVARWPGLMIVAAIYAGLYDDAEAPENDTAITEFECPTCENPVDVRFTEGDLRTGVYLHCEDHFETSTYWFPPGAQQGRSLSDLMRIAYIRLLTNVRLARQGICMDCWGRVSTAYTGELPDNLGDEESRRDESVFVMFHCERCWNRRYLPLRTYVASHPVVESAFAERGYEPLEAAYALAVGDGLTCDERLTNDDPPKASVRITFAGEALTVWLDDECSVIEHQWN